MGRHWWRSVGRKRIVWATQRTGRHGQLRWYSPSGYVGSRINNWILFANRDTLATHFYSILCNLVEGDILHPNRDAFRGHYSPQRSLSSLDVRYYNSLGKLPWNHQWIRILAIDLQGHLSLESVYLLFDILLLLLQSPISMVRWKRVLAAVAIFTIVYWRFRGFFCFRPPGLNARSVGRWKCCLVVSVCGWTAYILPLTRSLCTHRRIALETRTTAEQRMVKRGWLKGSGVVDKWFSASRFTCAFLYS